MRWPAIQQRLTEADWKARGLPLRTTLEKMKTRKTMISEALRDYARVAHELPDQRAQKQAALRRIREVVDTCKRSHASNRNLLRHLGDMGSALREEVDGLNMVLDVIEMKDVNADAQLRGLFHAFARTEHVEETITFVYMLDQATTDVAKTNLYRTYIKAGAPKQINIPDGIRNALDRNPQDTKALQAARKSIVGMLELGVLPRFKQQYYLEGV